MWPRDLIRLPSLLSESILLLREQNQLLRELIHVVARRPAQTPPLSPHSMSTVTVPPPRPPLTRQFTGDDVFTVTPERRAQLDREAAERQGKPWRHPMETLAAIHEPLFDLDPTGVVETPQGLGYPAVSSPGAVSATSPNPKS